MNITEEQHEGVAVKSVFELIDEDASFVFPDCSGLYATVQDCWRIRERCATQDAVRSILTKMHIKYEELPDNRDKTEFCGSTLYRAQPEKNARFAPRHYVEQATGKFASHTEEEQLAIMRGYSARFKTPAVICYCHYCLEGLLQGGADARHLAVMLFKSGASGAA